MATTFDRMEFVRALRGKPGMQDETLEALADALHKQQESADYVTRKDLDLAVQTLTIRLGGGLVALGAFLAAIKFFA
jgi:hypothetical protein